MVGHDGVGTTSHHHCVEVCVHIQVGRGFIINLLAQRLHVIVELLRRVRALLADVLDQDRGRRAHEHAVLRDVAGLGALLLHGGEISCIRGVLGLHGVLLGADVRRHA